MYYNIAHFSDWLVTAVEVRGQYTAVPEDHVLTTSVEHSSLFNFSAQKVWRTKALFWFWPASILRNEAHLLKWHGYLLCNSPEWSQVYLFNAVSIRHLFFARYKQCTSLLIPVRLLLLFSKTSGTVDDTTVSFGALPGYMNSFHP
jgi:hypothetical protein